MANDKPQVITLPNNWEPRDYQLPVWRYLEGGGKRAVVVWPRRHGKDDLALHFTACAAMQRVGTYWHCLPESAQSRRAIWDAINPRTGLRRIDECFPDSICEVKRSQDMYIRLISGSSWSLVGSDNYDSLVGTPPVGIVFSEFALANPNAWGYLRPILADNGGWAMFVSTPRGRNHLYDLFKFAEDDPKWFAEHLTVDDTGVLDKEQLASELKEYQAMYGPEEGYAMFRQEYYCAWDGAVSGSYYGALLDQAEEDGRITNVPYDPSLPVVTSWDLGMGDATGIWFAQFHNQEIRLIDYYEASGEGLTHYVKVLKDRPYVIESSILPHDVKVRELGTGLSRYEMLQKIGLNNITIAKKLPVDDGINAVRTALPRIWIDRKKCRIGLDHLRNYRKEYDEVRKEYKSRPYHDKSSHGADSLKYLIIGHHPPVKTKTVTEAMQHINFQGVW